MQVVLLGLNTLLPLLQPPLLALQPKLSRLYYSLLAFMAEAHPDQVGMSFYGTVCGMHVPFK